jgi:hypothetical protein
MSPDISWPGNAGRLGFIHALLLLMKLDSRLLWFLVLHPPRHVLIFGSEQLKLPMTFRVRGWILTNDIRRTSGSSN